MTTLQARTGLVAVDGAAVPGASVAFGGRRLVCTMTVGVSGGTFTAVDVRGAIEGSVDGGTTWFEIVRFPDQTTVTGGTKQARANGVAAASVGAAFGAVALGTPSAGGAVTMDGPFPPIMRATSKVETYTLATGTPAVAITISAYEGL